MDSTPATHPDAAPPPATLQGEFAFARETRTPRSFKRTRRIERLPAERRLELPEELFRTGVASSAATDRAVDFADRSERPGGVVEVFVTLFATLAFGLGVAALEERWTVGEPDARATAASVPDYAGLATDRVAGGPDRWSETNGAPSERPTAPSKR